MKMSEEWKAIPGYAGLYEVSDAGRVRSLRTGKMLSLHPNSNGYLRARMEDKHKLVHRLVLSAFLGVSMLHGNHKNGDKTDNRLVNLEYLTRSGNMQHLYHVLGHKQKGGPVGERAHLARLTAGKVTEMRRLYDQGIGTTELAAMYGVSISACSRAIAGETWHHVAGAVKLRTLAEASRNRWGRTDEGTSITQR
jgi:hypothetical protein